MHTHTHTQIFDVARMSLIIMSFTSRFTDTHVEECHVFGGYEGEGPRVVGRALAESRGPDGHVQFPVHLDRNELELLSDDERGCFGMT